MNLIPIIKKYLPNSVTKLRNILAFFAFGILVSTGIQASAEVVDRVVAVVNEEPITLYELDRLMAEKLPEIKNSKTGSEKQANFKKYRSLALEKLVKDKLLAQELKKNSIEVTDADVDKAINSITQRNKMTEKELDRELRKKGSSLANYKKELRSQIQNLKFMGQVLGPKIRITDADLDEFFAQHPEKFGAYQSVEMAQVIIPLSPTASQDEIEKAQNTAKEVAKKARRGSNFQKLGESYSINANTAEKRVYQVRDLAAPIVAILADMKPGGVSEPVRSSNGLHIIKLFQRKTLAGEEYDAIREQIRERVYEAKMSEELEKYLEELKNKSYIEIKS